MKNNLAASGQHFCENIFVEMFANILLGKATFWRKSNLGQDFFEDYPLIKSVQKYVWANVRKHLDFKKF